MKSFRSFFFIAILITILVLGISSTLIYLTSTNTPVEPLSSKNTFQAHLSYALNVAKLIPLKITYRDFQDQIEFTLNQESTSTTIILSTQKNPVWQVASLQNIFKAAKMKGKDVALIDLSNDHPYVTLKNN